MSKEQTDNSKDKADVRKKCEEFSLKALDLMQEIPEDGVNQYLSKNFLDSSTSVGAILIESKAAPSKEEFAQYFDKALTRVNETKYWLILMEQTMKDKSGVIKELLEEAVVISKILFASIKTLKGKKTASQA